MLGLTKKKSPDQFGLTLIEVLIALAIVAIAMTAVMKATSQTIRANHYLENKTIALWVAKQIISEVQTHRLKLSDTGDSLKNKTNSLGRDWYWQADLASTPNKHIHILHVKVYENASEENEEGAPLISLESYIYNDSR